MNDILSQYLADAEFRRITRYDRLHSHLGNFASIAQSTGISRAHVSRVLRGRSGITLECLKRISISCGVGLDDIVWYIDQRRKLEHESKSIQQEVRQPE